MAQSIRHLVPRLEVFSFLQPKDYPILEKYAFTYQYEKGAYVFKEGTHGGYMFFIVDGEVEVIKQFDTKTHRIATLGRGRSMGEMSMLDGGARSATVRALTDLTLIVLKREDFHRLMEDYPKTANRIILGIAGLLSQSLRETTNEFTERSLSIC